jgi:hypothetical protein
MGDQEGQQGNAEDGEDGKPHASHQVQTQRTDPLSAAV